MVPLLKDTRKLFVNHNDEIREIFEKEPYSDYVFATNYERYVYYNSTYHGDEA